jgi:hypothetical protein
MPREEEEAFFVVVCEDCNAMLVWKAGEAEARATMDSHFEEYRHTVHLLVSYETRMTIPLE